MVSELLLEDTRLRGSEEEENARPASQQSLFFWVSDSETVGRVSEFRAQIPQGHQQYSLVKISKELRKFFRQMPYAGQKL